MNLIENLLIFLVFILMTQSIYAQKVNFEPGTIYLTDGREKTGLIERNTFLNTSKSIQFKTNQKGEVEKYLPNQLKGFRYSQDKTTFRSIAFNYYRDDGITKEKTNKVRRFARVLLAGKVDLLKVPFTQFEYNKEAYGSKNYLYLLKKGQEYIQIDLLQTKAVGNDIMVSKKYKGLLAYALGECNDISTLVQRIDFTDKSITDLVKKYHKCIGQTEQLTIFKESQPNIVSHSFRAGYLFINDDFLENETGFSLGYQSSVQMPALSRNIGFSFSLD